MGKAFRTLRASVRGKRKKKNFKHGGKQKFHFKNGG